MKKIFLNKSKNLKLSKQHEIISNFNLFLAKDYNVIDTINILKIKYQEFDFDYYLNCGFTITEIFRLYKFHEDCLLVLNTSEQSNKLKDGFSKSEKILVKKLEFKKQIMELIKYPILLLSISIIALLFLSKLLLPNFITLYESMGIELDRKFDLLLNFVIGLPNYLLILLIIVVILYLIFEYLEKNNKLNILLKIPILSKYYISFFNYIFVVNVSNLLSIGLRLDDIFYILHQQEDNYFLSKQANYIYKKVLQGYELHEILDKSIYYPSLISLIKEGEENNILVENLQNYFVLLNENREKKSKNFIFLMQPIFYLLFGGLIILMYSAIFMPMYDMMNQL